MANIYKLGVLDRLGLSFVDRYFEFVAENDEEARSLVGNYGRVCHPLACGPLWEIGRPDKSNNWIVRRDDEHRLIPLSIEVGQQ